VEVDLTPYLLKRELIKNRYKKFNIKEDK